MSTPQLFVPKIVHYANAGILDEYYKSNVTFAISIESSLKIIDSITKNNIPFSNNLLQTSDGQFVDGSSINDFNQKMINITKNFIDSTVEVLSLFRKKRLLDDTSQFLNTVHDNFLSNQQNFYKNLSNYICIFLFFHDMTTSPSMFPINSDDNLITGFDFSNYILSNKEDLLKTNLRNMHKFDFKLYKRIFKSFLKAFQTASITNQEILQKENLTMNSAIPSNLILYINRFLKFPSVFHSSLLNYLEKLDYYYDQLYQTESLWEAVIGHDQTDLESSLYELIALIGSCDYVSSVEVVEGGRGHTVGDVLEIEDGSKPAKIIVTNILNGHIREVDIVEPGQNFAVDDSLLDSAGSTLFNMSVSAIIVNGFVTNADVEDGGSGFVIGDNMNNGLSQGLNRFTPTYDEFFQGVNGQINTLNFNHRNNIPRWVARTSIYKDYIERGGTIVIYDGDAYEFNPDLTQGGVESFISKLFTRFSENTGLNKLAILLLEQMASINNVFDDVIRDTMRNTYNINNNTISSIESSYSSNPQNIIEQVVLSSGTGTGIEISVTDISGELASPTLNFVNTGNYSLSYDEVQVQIASPLEKHR